MGFILGACTRCGEELSNREHWTNLRLHKDCYALNERDAEARRLDTPWATFATMVKSLFKRKESFDWNLMHAAAGISGEAGEVMDAVKKLWAYGKQLDRENMIEELGDLEFYMEAMRQELGVSREEILIANMRKLSKRYHTGSYSDAQAQARADKAGA